MAEGLELAAPQPGADARVSRATLASQVEDAIRFDIIAGALEPGRRLRAAELTARYGVSATPLREALQRLAAQSLVELGPRLGATVAGTSEGELRDIYALREVLEPMALERSILLGTEAWERDVASARDAFVRSAAETPRGPDGHPDPEQILSWSGVHRRFHDALFEACDSAWLLRFVGILSHHSERYRLLSHRHARRHPLEEHEEIYRAAIDRDAPRAVDALRRHLSRTVATLREAVDGATQAPDGRQGNDAVEALAR